MFREKRFIWKELSCDASDRQRQEVDLTDAEFRALNGVAGGAFLSRTLAILEVGPGEIVDGVRVATRYGLRRIARGKRTAELRLSEEEEAERLAGFYQALDSMSAHSQNLYVWLDEVLEPAMALDDFDLEAFNACLDDPRCVAFEKAFDALKKANMAFRDTPIFAMIEHMVESASSRIIGRLSFLSSSEDQYWADDLADFKAVFPNIIARSKIFFDQYLPLLKEEGLGFSEVSLLELLERAKESLPAHSGNIILPSDLDLQTATFKWGTIALLENLFNNAFKAGANNVWVYTVVRDGRIVVSIHDDAKEAIPDEVLAKLFKDPVPSETGSGNGCRVAKAFVRDLAKVVGEDPQFRRQYGVIEGNGSRFGDISMHQRLGDDGGVVEKYVKLTLPLVEAA